MAHLNKPIAVRLLADAEEYILNQDEKIQRKFFLLFDKLQAGYKGDWFKKLKGTDSIYEFRLKDSQKFYRVFAFWASTDKTTLVIGTHGFDKKSNKSPRGEIKKAQQIRDNYFTDKNQEK